MNKITESFKNGKTVIGFVTAGDPDIETSKEIIVKMADAGCDLIEIGIPFSDPIAEGPDIQEANLRALTGGITTDKVFEITESVSKIIDAPIVYMTYLNVLFKYGYDSFMKKASEAGVCGVLIPDLPYEEKDELLPYGEKYSVEVLSISAPAEKSRIEMISKSAKGFIYAISTAQGEKAEKDLTELCRTLKSSGSVPVAVDPNIVTGDDARKYSQIADGIILSIGIVKTIAENQGNAPRAVYDYVRGIKNALTEN